MSLQGLWKSFHKTKMEMHEKYEVSCIGFKRPVHLRQSNVDHIAL